MATPDKLDITSWHLVDLEANADAVWRSHLQHSHSQMHESNETGANTTGYTVWSAMMGDRQIGIAWDWISIGRQVVAMANPMQISTNVRLYSADGIMLSSSSAVVHLNDIIHDLPWQQYINASVRRIRHSRHGVQNARLRLGSLRLHMQN